MSRTTKQHPWRILVTAVAAVIYGVLLFQLLPALALDIEALIINVYPDHLHKNTAVWWSGLILRWGSLPLAAPLLARLLLWALSPRLGSWAGLLGRIPLPLKILWALLLLALYGVFCVPLAAGLSVWLSVDAYWWIQWYQNVRPLLDQVLSYSIYVALPGLWLLAPILLRYHLWGPSKVRPRARVWAIRGLAALLWLVALGALAPAILVGGVHASRLVLTPGRAILEHTCNQCHARTRPLYFIKTPAEWRRTITRMKEHEKAPLNHEQREEVLAFLGGMRSFSDAWTFRSRCQRCHVASYLGWEDRTAQDWAAIVDRIGRWSPYYYKKDVRDQVVAHLTATRFSQGSTLGLDRETYLRFWNVGKVCSSCHSISREGARYRRRDLEAITRLVTDMREKMVDPFDRGKIRSTAATYKELISAPDRLRKLFPHDKLVEEGGPPW